MKSALVAVGVLAGAAHAHDAHPGDGYPITPPGASQFRSAAQGSHRVWVQGEIVIVEDDGTMIQSGQFVPQNVLPMFYASIPDSFEFVNLFGATSFPQPMVADASEYLVRLKASGLGRWSGLNRNLPLGISTQRLLSVQFMNDPRDYGATPTDGVPRFAPTDFTGVELLGSEVLHAASCWVDVDQVVPGGIEGRFAAHWNFFLDSQASVMEGCEWLDNGDGSFTTQAVLDGIGELEEYLLGLRPPEDVSPMFLIANPSPAPPGSSAAAPVSGYTTWGTRVDFTIDDIIAQNGPRVPDAASAPHHFRMAFALVIPAGTTPLPQDLAFLEQFRSDWETWFAAETEGLGTMDTSIPRVPVAADFTTDVLVGPPPLTVEFRNLSSGTISGHTWDFGDGSPPCTHPNPVHTYTAPGTYDVALTVEGVGGPTVKTAPGAVVAGPFLEVVLDDFESDQGWTLCSTPGAAAGDWERGDPEGTSTFSTPVQPEDDATPTGTMCWVTGLLAGDYPEHHDVDGGPTILCSPLYDLSATDDPYVSYARWYTNAMSGTTEEDEMLVEVTVDGGAQWTTLEIVLDSDVKFRTAQFRLRDFVTPSSQTGFRFHASDLYAASLVEAAIDDFKILDAPGITAVPRRQAARPRRLRVISLAPNPFHSAVTLRFEGPAGRRAVVSVIDAAGRRVRTLVGPGGAGGVRSVTWDGRDARGRAVAGGIYWLRLEAGSSSVARPVIRSR